jgi:hypothetical protein
MQRAPGIRRLAAGERGSVLVITAAIGSLLLLSAALFAAFAPMFLGIEVRESQRAAQQDRRDAIQSWLYARLGGKSADPLRAATESGLEWVYDPPQEGAPNVCYRLELDRSAGALVAASAPWDGSACGAYGSSFVLADGVSDEHGPLFRYYRDQRGRDEIDDLSATDPDCLEGSTPIAEARCARSIVVRPTIERYGRAWAFADEFLVTFGTLVDTSRLANGAVTDAKLGGTIDPDRLRDGSLTPRSLAFALASTFTVQNVISVNRMNYQAPSGELDRWRTNQTSPQATVGGVTYLAGNAARPTVAIDWDAYCRPGYVLEARARFTANRPLSGAPLSLQARLLHFERAGADGFASAQGVALFESAVGSISSDKHIVLASPWQIIDYGSCDERVNALLDPERGPFLYRLQSKASAGDVFILPTVVLDIRWQPALVLSGSAYAPDTPLLGAPASDATVSAGGAPALAARFMDRNADDRGTLQFQLCADAACSLLLASGEARDLRVGSFGSWQPALSLSSGQSYYWRARAVDRAGAQSAWTDTSRILVP